MHDDLTRIEKDHDALSRRVGDLEEREEARKGESAKPSKSAAIESPKPEAKPLKIVKLAPSGPVEPPTASEVEEEDDDAPRPVIKIGPKGPVETTYPDESSSVGKKKAKSKGAIDPQAATDYDTALALVKAKKPKQALDALAGFILRYPDHPYVANAMYWRAECYYSIGEHGNAVTQLEGLLARFPSSLKTPDALLKLGLSEKKLGNPAKAKVAFARLKKEFPISEAAKKIPPEDAK